MEATSNFINSSFLAGNAPFPQEHMDKLYPKEKWRNEFSLHYLIAGQGDIKDIEETAKAKPKGISLCDPQNSNLTPLHLAAMKASQAVAEILLKYDPEGLQKKSKEGFTPLHISALTSDDLFDFFQGMGGDPKLKADNGLSCYDLRVLSGRKLTVLTDLSLLFSRK